MVNINIFNGRSLTEEEIALGTPDKSEARNLNHHVERCAMRYKLFATRQAELGNEVGQVKAILILLCAYIVAVSEPARNMLNFLKGLI